MGITLVVLLLLQMLSVLILWDWGSEPFRQLVVERLVSQAPMALVGLVLMYLSSRLEDLSGSQARTPLLWSVCIISGLLAVLLTAALPIAFGGDQILQEQTDQQLAAQRAQLATGLAELGDGEAAVTCLSGGGSQVNEALSADARLTLGRTLLKGSPERRSQAFEPGAGSGSRCSPAQRASATSAPAWTCSRPRPTPTMRSNRRSARSPT